METWQALDLLENIFSTLFSNLDREIEKEWCQVEAKGSEVP